MLNDKFVILPDQLFHDNKHIQLLKTFKKIYLVEDPSYFNANYHFQKLVLHRSSMKAYQEFLHSKNIQVTYVNFKHFDKNIYKNCHVINPLNYDIQDLFKNSVFLEQPTFLLTHKEILDNNFKQFSSLYTYLRKKTLLIKKSEGEKYSLDEENRGKIQDAKHAQKYDTRLRVQQTEFHEEAIKYIKKNFDRNYSVFTDKSYYVCTRNSALKKLYYFVQEILQNFGDGQDYTVKENITNYHSVLSMYLNIGIITDQDIRITQKNKKHVEAYFRQICWRNYMRAVYILQPDISDKNLWKNMHKIPRYFWEGKTQIEILNTEIHKLKVFGYSHHIVRLMLFGNIMVLCQFHPQEIYDWFMCMYIDSYPWVMYGNVYGMLYFSNKVMKKPYLSSSNYLQRMSGTIDNSQYLTKQDYYNIYCLFYGFIAKNKKKISHIYGIQQFVDFWERKSNEEKNEIKKKYQSLIQK